MKLVPLQFRPGTQSQLVLCALIALALSGAFACPALDLAPPMRGGLVLLYQMLARWCVAMLIENAMHSVIRP